MSSTVTDKKNSSQLWWNFQTAAKVTAESSLSWRDKCSNVLPSTGSIQWTLYFEPLLVVTINDDLFCVSETGLSCQTGRAFILSLLEQRPVPSGYICSYNTAFKGLCPSSYCCDLHHGALGQKVSSRALDLAGHILPWLLLILLSWEYGSSIPRSPTSAKVLLKTPLCLLCACVLVCVIALLATSYPCCHNVLSSDAAQICRVSWFSTGQMDVSIFKWSCHFAPVKYVKMSPWNATNKCVYIHDNIFSIWKIEQQFNYFFFLTFYELDSGFFI